MQKSLSGKNAVLVTQSNLTLCNPAGCSLPGSSMEFSRQEYWSGLLCPPRWGHPDSRIERGSPQLQADSLPSVAQLVKNLPAMQGTWVQSLGGEDSLEKGKTTHSSVLAWRILWTTVHGAAKSRAQLSDFHFTFTFFTIWASREIPNPFTVGIPYDFWQHSLGKLAQETQLPPLWKRKDLNMLSSLSGHCLVTCLNYTRTDYNAWPHPFFI